MLQFDAAGFADSLFSNEGATTGGVIDGALDNNPIDPGGELTVDYRNMGGLSSTADSAFFDAVQRGTDQMQGSLYATANAIGAVTGFDGVAEWGLEGFRDNLREAAINPAKVASFEDIDSLSTLGTYIAEGLGENAANMALMATGGGISAKMAMAGIGKAAIERMGKEAATKALTKAAGKGAFKASYGLGAGEVQGEFLENGIHAPGTALLAGIPIAGLDVLGFEKILGTAFKGMPVTSSKQLVTQAAKAFGIGGAAELPTEATQELIGMVARAAEDPSFELFTEENAKRLAEAGIKGGLVGGVMGGGGATAVGVAKGINESGVIAKGAAGVENYLGGGGVREAARQSRAEANAALRAAAEAKANGVAPAPAPAAGPTAPEPTETLQAGADAIGRGGRLAAYSSNPRGFDTVEKKPDHIILHAEDGGAYYVHKDLANKVAALDSMGKQAEILGYPGEKPPGEDNPTVVQAKDAQGRTVQDVATSAADLAAAKAQGQEAAGPGGTVHVTDAATAVNQRKSDYETDDGTLDGRDNRERNADGTPKINPDDLIGALTDEAMQPEAQTFTVKHNTTARLMKALYGTEAVTNSDGSRNVTLSGQAPKVTQSDPNETHPMVVKAVAKMFDDGKTEERGRIQVHNPHSKEGTNTPVSLPGVIRLGQQLNQLNDTATDRKSNLLTGLGHLYALGFTPTKVRVKENGKFVDRPLNITNGKETRLGLPLNTVIDGREETGTAVTFGDIMGRNPSVKQKTKKQRLDEYDKKSAQHKAMTSGTQRDKNKATLRHKQNATKLGKEVEAIKAELENTYGVEFKDGQADNREFEQKAETSDGKGVSGDNIIKATRKETVDNAAQADRAAAKIPIESGEDTRGLPTEDDQAKTSARDVLPKKKGSIKFAALRNNKVAQYSTKLNKKLVDFTSNALKMLGIKTQVNLMDEDGAVYFIEEMKAERAETTDEARQKVLDQKIAELEQLLTDSPLGRIIYNDRYELAGDRVPTVFVSQNNRALHKQLRVLTHELGHLLQRVAFDQAPKDVQEAIKRSMAGTQASRSNQFQENFANMLWRYMMKLDAKVSHEYDRLSSRDAEIARSIIRSDETKVNEAERKQQLKDLMFLDKFFTKLAKKLRQLWQALTKTHGVNEEYQDFVDAMVGAKIRLDGKEPVTRLGKKYVKIVDEMTMGPFMAYRPDNGPAADNWSADDIRALGNRVVMHRRGKVLVDGAKLARRTYELAQDKVFRSADAYLRSLDSPLITAIANEFHHQPGLKKVGRAFFEEVRYFHGQRQAKLDSILAGLPKKKSTKPKFVFREQVDNESAEYLDLVDKLQSGFTRDEFEQMGGVVGEAGVKIRDYLEDMRTWLEAQGVSVKKRANYFPSIADAGAWASNKDAILKVFQAHGYELAYAEKVYAAMSENDGYLADIYNEDDKMLGPGFSFMKKRKLDNVLLADLRPYMLQDMQGILQQYTRASVERGVAQRRWGFTSAEKIAKEGEMRSLGIVEHINSPIAKLHFQLAKALREGEITLDQFHVIKNKVLEAYFGRLGANIDKRWQKFQGAMIVYQNVRLLSLATLTAFVDAGQIVWRGGDARLAWKGVQTVLNKQSREEAYHMARMIGNIQDDLTEHVLNDQTTNKYLSPKFQMWNERFFRAIGMHHWTNLTRVLSMSVGTEFLLEHAARAAAGDAKSLQHLAELGVSFNDVQQWEAVGRPYNDLSDTDSHSRVISALNTFVDESVVRPDATTRPAWASDKNMQLLFHLKSFAWGYQEVILRRLWNQAKNEPTTMKALQQGGLSAAMLVAMTMPLAMAGYELRRLISWWGSPPERSELHGLDYFTELAERAGYLGIFQFMADADQAQDFGRTSILSVAGPSLSQLEEFFRDDYASIITRGTPFLAQSGAGRAIARDLLRFD